MTYIYLKIIDENDTDYTCVPSTYLCEKKEIEIDYPKDCKACEYNSICRK